MHNPTNTPHTLPDALDALDETQGELKALKQYIVDCDKKLSTELVYPLVPGRYYYIRTATYAAIGRLAALGPMAFKLDEATFVDESGTIAPVVAEGKPPKLGEPLPNGLVVFWGGMIDAQRCAKPVQQEEKASS